jgi:DNA-binding IclR family transcriptional regulator
MRALDVLDAFNEENPQMSLTELNRVLGLSDASLFRTLVTLQARGYLQKNSDGSYELAPRILRGQLALRAEALRSHALPELRRLASTVNETASLAYFFGDRIQVIECIESLHDVRMTNRIGRVLPPHCSGLGKAITAFQPPEVMATLIECYGLLPRTGHTITSHAELLAHYEMVRRTGIAADREESMPGGICLAAPIHLGDRVIAAISVSTPSSRMTEEREESTVGCVRKAAKAISLRADATGAHSKT